MYVPSARPADRVPSVTSFVLSPPVLSCIMWIRALFRLATYDDV